MNTQNDYLVQLSAPYEYLNVYLNKYEFESPHFWHNDTKKWCWHYHDNQPNHVLAWYWILLAKLLKWFACWSFDATHNESMIKKKQKNQIWK